MFGNLILAVGSAWAALALWPYPGIVQSLAGGFGVCVDDKGLYWETLLPLFRRLGRERDLVLL